MAETEQSPAKQEFIQKSIQFWNPGKTQFWQDAGVDLVIDRRQEPALRLGRTESYHVRVFNPSALIKEVLTLVQPKAAACRVQVVTDFAARDPALRGDPQVLKQALLNLTINACHAMPNGGTLKLICRPASRRRRAARASSSVTTGRR